MHRPRRQHRHWPPHSLAVRDRASRHAHLGWRAARTMDPPTKRTPRRPHLAGRNPRVAAEIGRHRRGETCAQVKPTWIGGRTCSLPPSAPPLPRCLAPPLPASLPPPFPSPPPHRSASPPPSPLAPACPLRAQIRKYGCLRVRRCDIKLVFECMCACIVSCVTRCVAGVVYGVLPLCMH